MSGAQFFTGANRNTFDGATVNNVGGDQTQHHGPTGPIHNDRRTFNGQISSYKENDNRTVNGRSIENYGSYREDNDYSTRTVNGNDFSRRVHGDDNSRTAVGNYTENNGRSQGDNNVARNPNLLTPEKLKDAFYGYFEPVIIEYAGFNQPWKDPSPRDVQNLWKKVVPNEFHGQFSSFSITIENLVAEALTKWRDSFGNAAVEALESIFAEQDLYDVNERKNYIADQRAGSRLQNRPYYFTGTRNGAATGAFQSHIVAKTLSEHFKAIQKIPVTKRSSSPPSGALILTIFAIERTLDHYSSGKENVGPLGDLSKDSQALPMIRRIQAFTTGKTSKGQDWIPYEVWSRIIAAAQSHIEPPPIMVQENLDGDDVLEDSEPYQ
ncbi:hypothetical protein K435DRAFT_844788 [Dendrothele bispora CBS 962.96]|uniref:Uncharacterized protein n=1 Tax=Dendrothele bispora (strain CBS 962.96) TaxID=1314807 RepID=A0A4S8KYY9_DENBC|nr:hypothetical protein K435DRAFT_844788 [Dendrothele bispora CBS 962.96]